MKVYEFLADERHGWCVGAYARTKTGRPCRYYSRRAVAWSLLGAMMRIVPDEDYGDASNAVLRITLVPPEEWAERPGRTRQDIVELLRRLDI